MGAEHYITGDRAADCVMRLIAAHADAAPQINRDAIWSGDQSLFFAVSYIAQRAELDAHDTVAALARLDDHNYIRIQHRNHGVDVWMRSRVLAVA